MDVKDWSEHKPAVFEYKGGNWIRNWFSNFTSCNLVIGGKIWPSVENYYQAMKTLDLDKQEQIRRMTPAESKRAGRKVKVRDDWEKVKTGVMRMALEVKFSLPEWKAKLLADTGTIVEWNNWGDRIWGATLDGMGENRLGVLLMEIRDNYLKEKA